MADERDEGDELEAAEGGGARSLWSGSITFGLLSLAVDLFPAVRSDALPLKLVDASLNPLTRRYECPEHGRFLSRDEIVRGYELDDGEFVVVTDDELESLAPEKSRAIDLRKFVDIAEVDPMYFRRSYFLTPAENEANRAYRLLAETMERSGRAGIATFVMRGKEYLVALLAENGVLRAETLRFSDEIRAPRDVGLPIDAEADPREVERFRRAIEALAADGVDRALLRDERVERVRALIDDK
ncbi:MAG TPA: Ku protein, partial [Planctomycetota bacterium]|nr:Ku protein [Planctomycetota bacterium]